MYLLLDLLHPVHRDPAAGFELAPTFGGAGAAALLYDRIAQGVLDLALYAEVRARALADVERITAIFADKIRLEGAGSGL